MKYRIYNFIEKKTILYAEEMSDMLSWLNDNEINIDDCLMQYLDEKYMKWRNF